MKKTGLVFSHCHWDIEWYMPLHSFRFWLKELIERLIKITEEDPRFKTYVLDGQVAPVEHYLTVAPEKLKSIKQLIRSGKLSIGPFYTQFDEWLISPESIVRNCLWGNRRARKFGRIMNAGYLPDNFGHPCQMPQILAGFGIDSIIFMRGMPDKPKGMKDEFFWQGLDGTKTLGIHLAGGYCNAACLGARRNIAGITFRTAPYGDHFIGFEWLMERVTDCDVDEGAKYLVEIARKAGPGYPSGVIPLANGLDHCPPQAQIPDIIERANRTQNEFRFVHGNCEDLVKMVKRAGKPLQTFSGEFWGARYWNLHMGTLSTRTYIKQDNFFAESLLEKYAEPLATVANLNGKDYPAAQLKEAWRFMLMNHAHDSIHGSSVDPVHCEMVQRYLAVRQTATGICHDSLKHLGKCHVGPSGQVTTWRLRRRRGMTEWPGTRQPGILVYNPVDSDSLPAIIGLWVNADDDHFHIEDGEGRALPTQILENSLGSANNKRSFYNPWPCGDPFPVLFAAPVSQRGVASFAIVHGKANPPSVRTKANFIENEYLRVSFRKGSLDVYDKDTKRWYRGLNIIEDEADAGDVWDFSEPMEPSRGYSSDHFPAKCRRVENGPVRSTLLVETCMRVPCCLNQEKRSRKMVPLPIKARVSLVRGARRVDVSLTLDNQARDHRLRLKCPTGIASETVKSQGHFGIIKRPLRNRYTGKNWVQTPSQTFHFRERIAVENRRHGLAVVCQGLNEYEARRGGRGVVLYVTLLRGVGRMSKNKMKSRATPAAMMSVPVPDAQCLGEQSFDYAFVPYSCDNKEDSAFFSAAVNAFLYPPMAHLIRDKKAGKTRDIEGFPFDLKPANLMVSCFKKSEDDRHVILRFWENEGRKTLARLTLSDRFTRVFQVNLNEEPLAEIKVEKNQLKIKVRPYQIITLRLEV